MTDLLQPDDVRGTLFRVVACLSVDRWGPERPVLVDEMPRLCRDYLTLWEKHEKKKAALKDRGVIESVLEICEEERDALKARVKELEEARPDLEGRVLP